MREFLLCMLAMVFIGCADTDRNEERAAEWVSRASKPIVCKIHCTNGWDMDRKYTLVDAKGNIYQTGWVSMTLPDTIGVKP